MREAPPLPGLLRLHDVSTVQKTVRNSTMQPDQHVFTKMEGCLPLFVPVLILAAMRLLSCRSYKAAILCLAAAPVSLLGPFVLLIGPPVCSSAALCLKYWFCKENRFKQCSRRQHHPFQPSVNEFAWSPRMCDAYMLADTGILLC